jgi:hypothetical protein
MVRYKVKADRAAENEQLVRAVYDELSRSQATDIRYATVVLEDGVSFVHIASQEADTNPLTRLEAFQAFQEKIGERCDELPVVSEFREIGSYRFFAE